MRYVKWTFFAVLAILVVSVLHYTLPRHDVVRIVGTENRRIDFGENSFFWTGADVGSGEQTTRDVRFIQAVRPNGRERVYRNEDTGWGWPPYFKMNSANLQARAQDMVSTADNPRWVAVTHYGWRTELFSIFPNALRIRPVAGPDATVVPWSAIIILTVLAAGLGWIALLWRRFRLRSVEPALARFDDAMDRADAHLDETRDQVKSGWKRFTGWFGGK